MKRKSREPSGIRRRRTALLGAGLAVALAAPLLGAAPAAGQPPAAPPAPQKQATEEAKALAEAVESGKRVEVLSRRSETAQTFANPDGSFTTDQFATAQRVRRGGKFVDIDTTLTRNKNGTFSAKATEVGVIFSGGGKGPLATVTRDGRSLSWSWPGKLPAPDVDGDSVVYRDVLPDVDLKLTAGSAGFGQLLIVRNAKAAANPALRKIKLPLDTKGLRVEADKHGSLRAVNPAGQEVFTAPTPMMWDSSRPAASSARSTEPPPPPPAHDFEPPYGAKKAAMGTDIEAGHLALTPDTDVLRGPGTRYPVYIDPSVSGAREAWTIAYSSAANTGFYNGNGWQEGDGDSVTSYARVGNPGDGTSRSFFRMDTNNLWNTNKVISSSVFRIKNAYSYSCTHREVQLWLTGGISSATTWNKQPSWAQKLDTVSEAKGYSSSCPAGNLAFDVTTGAKKAQSSKWNNITLGMRATSEGDRFAYKRFTATSAVLSTTYNTVPDVPGSLDTNPSTGCDTTSPYPIIGNTDVYLTAKVSDRDGGTVKAQFRLWGNNSYAGGAEIFDQTVSVSSGTIAKVRVPKATLAAALDKAGGIFGWKVRAQDSTASSSWTPSTTCRFVFDPDRPSYPPGVTSTQFPDGSDGWPYNTSSVRTEGTFTLSSGGVSDVTKYEYWTDWDSTRRTATPSGPGGSVSIKLTPTNTGANQVYAKSYDKANNPSDTAVYLFYANGPKTPDKPGDLNGDGNADLWGVDKDGTLRRFYGAGDGTVTEADRTASNHNWNDVLISHRGDWNSDGYEDLIALRPDSATGTSRLWLHPNSGFGFACTDCSTAYTRQELTVYDPANNHWSGGAKQILAIGDVDGGIDTDGDGTEDIPGYPDLLVNDSTHIWLYYGNPDRRLDSDREPVLLAGPDDPIATGSSTVGEVTLAAPGDWNKDGQADLVVRYDRPDTGGLFVFHGRENEYGYDISVDERSSIGWNWSTDTVPQFALAPDADNSGNPLDFFATTAGSGRLRFLGNHEVDTGHTTYKEASLAFAGYQAIS
ncbi:VCBS repeat-containing protein [Streptomyces sp. KLOTTS4A1]|uniref:VCBS repeat-containing protein n=1 Tax=Streptomyces sp. KLOTTS4A1 TaxID=3390996 RepID=UPI0039F44A45